MRTTVIEYAFGAILLVLIVAALAGCATVPHADQADQRAVVSVDKVVVASCAAAKDVPTLPAGVGAQLNGNAVHDVAILAAAVLDDRAWQGKALAIIKGCAG